MLVTCEHGDGAKEDYPGDPSGYSEVGSQCVLFYIDGVWVGRKAVAVQGVGRVANPRRLVCHQWHLNGLVGAPPEQACLLLAEPLDLDTVSNWNRNRTKETDLDDLVQHAPSMEE